MIERLGGSFRDPAGFVFRRDGVLYRQVNERARGDFDLLTSSGLYEELARDGLLVPHEEAPASEAAAPGAYKVIRPRVVPFVSYPYEWSFGQLKDAALLTLEVQRRAQACGMTLRDASAYNVQFDRGRPVLIDTLSLGRADDRPWIGYRQFCQHFLAPLALAAYTDARLIELLRVHIDGVPLDLAARLLPRRARFRPGIGVHIFLHAKVQQRASGASGRARTVSARGAQGLLENLTGTIGKLSWVPPRTVWTEYYGEAGSYEREAFARKLEIVREMLADAGPAQVWDLGANTGAFSRVAAERTETVVAFDLDDGCVEAAYRECRTAAPNVLPLVQDLTNPSPPVGWANAERLSLAQRGPADLAMALALVHHLAIGNNVPLPDIASYLRTLCRSLVIEWVPKEDHRVQTLLASREDVFDDYTHAGFEAAFSSRFTIARREPIPGSGRVLYLMR